MYSFDHLSKTVERAKARNELPKYKLTKLRIQLAICKEISNFKENSESKSEFAIQEIKDFRSEMKKASDESAAISRRLYWLAIIAVIIAFGAICLGIVPGVVQ